MIINSVICMGANAFRVYLISRFMKVFFRTEEIPGRKIILAYGLFYAVNTFLYLTLRTAFINIACNLVGIFLLNAAVSCADQNEAVCDGYHMCIKYGV